MSVSDVPVFKKIEKKMCTGCECCANICPRQCISMCPNEEGFLYPVVDAMACINCKMCINVCPVNNNLNASKLLLDSYVGYAKSKETVNASASGGMFSLIVEEFMNISNRNGYVCGVIWDEDFKGTCHIISNDNSCINAMRSSKYIQSKKGNIYQKVKERLESGYYVLFSGTPCECAGLLSFVGKKYEKLYIVDLVCQGPTTPLAMNQFVESISKNGKFPIKAINMRYVYKKPWIPQWIKVEFENKKPFVKLFYETSIGRSVHILQRKSCSSCLFQGDNRISDMTIGDHHGAKIQDPCYNPYGTSILIINTEHGKQLFRKLRKNANLSRVNYDDLLDKNPRIAIPGKEHIKREKFSSDLTNANLYIAARNSWSNRERVRTHLPYCLRMIIRKIRRFVKFNSKNRGKT